MIDVMLIISVVASIAVFGTRHISWRLLVLGSFGCVAVFHALCLIALYQEQAVYDYVVHPSPASQAGLMGGGAVRRPENGLVQNLGDFLGGAFSGTLQAFHATRSFSLHYRNRDYWKFWRAIDGYALEEAAGGLAVFPRRPNLREPGIRLASQIESYRRGEPVRILAVHGEPVNTIGAVLRELERMPENGILPFRIMRPTPDDSVRTILFSDAFLERKTIPIAASAQDYLGFSGMHFLFRRQNGARDGYKVKSISRTNVFGPEGIAAVIGASKPEELIFYVEGGQIGAQEWATFSGVILYPRLALLPWLDKRLALSFAAGLVGPALRQLLSLSNLYHVVETWSALPKQYYLLDDPFTLPSLFFKLSSLAASLLLALLLWQGFRWAGFKANRQLFVWCAVVLLQAADLFVFHRILI